MASFTHSSFWAPPAYWIPSYRCRICKEIMAQKSPVILRSCSHAFCADCISKHVLLDGNVLCPCCSRRIDAHPIAPLPKDDDIPKSGCGAAGIRGAFRRIQLSVS